MVNFSSLGCSYVFIGERVSLLSLRLPIYYHCILPLPGFTNIMLFRNSIFFHENPMDSQRTIATAPIWKMLLKPLYRSSLLKVIRSHLYIEDWLVTEHFYLPPPRHWSPCKKNNSIDGARLSVHFDTRAFIIKIFVEEQKVPHCQLTCQILGPAASLVLDVTEWQMVNGHISV